MSDPVNIDRMVQGFHARMSRLLVDIEDMKADLREIELEAKAMGYDAKEIRAWAAAEIKDKTGKRRDKLLLSLTYARALGVDVGIDLNSTHERSESGTVQSDPAGSLEPGEAGGLVKASPEPSNPIQESQAKPLDESGSGEHAGRCAAPAATPDEDESGSRASGGAGTTAPIPEPVAQPPCVRDGQPPVTLAPLGVTGGAIDLTIPEYLRRQRA